MENVTAELTLAGTVSKYHVVTAAGEVTSAATDIPYGIAQDDGVAGDTIAVVVLGKTKAIAADASVALGDALSAVADGEVDTNAGTATHYVCGRATQDSPAANGYVEILFNPNLVAQA